MSRVAGSSAASRGAECRCSRSSCNLRRCIRASVEVLEPIGADSGCHHVLVAQRGDGTTRSCAAARPFIRTLFRRKLIALTVEKTAGQPSSPAPKHENAELRRGQRHPHGDVGDSRDRCGDGRQKVNMACGAVRRYCRTRLRDRNRRARGSRSELNRSAQHRQRIPVLHLELHVRSGGRSRLPGRVAAIQAKDLVLQGCVGGNRYPRAEDHQPGAEGAGNAELLGNGLGDRPQQL